MFAPFAMVQLHLSKYFEHRGVVICDTCFACDSTSFWRSHQKMVTTIKGIDRLTLSCATVHNHPIHR